MRSVSILIPINDNLLPFKLCLESAIQNCGLSDVQLLFFNNGSGSVESEFSQLAKNHPTSKFFSSDTVVRNSDVLNYLLLECDNEYVCIIPGPVFLPNNWLLNMVCSNSQVCDTGITAIGSQLGKRGSLTPKMNQEQEFEYVYQQENNQVKGVWLFHRSILDLIGGFDPELNCGYEFLQFSHRISKHNLANYYLVGFSSIKIPFTQLVLFATSKPEYLENIKRLAKSNDYHIKIIPTPPSVKTARPLLPALMDKFGSTRKTPFYLELSESWGFDLIGFSQEETKHLDKFCKEHKLEYMVLPPKSLEIGMSINFFDK
jgi:hypothetical protein